MSPLVHAYAPRSLHASRVSDNRGGIYRHLASFHSESETALTPTESGVNPPPHIALILVVKMGFADSPDVEDRSITAQDTHDP